MLDQGDIVLFPFPHTDLSRAKARPALILKKLAGKDAIVCMLTTQKAACTGHAILVDTSNLSAGNLHKPSNIRPDRLFTADTEIFFQTIGTISDSKLQEVYSRLREMFS
jgi:mRNA interferase MazF